MRLAVIVAMTIWFSAIDANGQSDGGSYVDSNGVRIHYTDRGSGPAVLLMHGFQSSKAQWESALAPRLLQDGLRVIAYDARGHGASGKPVDPEQYGEEDVKDVIRLPDYLKIRRVHVVGYSRGASIASRVAAQHSERVQSIVFGGWGVDNPVDTLEPSECDAAAEAIERGDPPMPLLRALTPAGSGSAARPTQAGGQGRTPEARVALAAAFRAVCRTPRVTAAALGATGLPALAIVGEADGMAASVKRMASQLPNL